MGSKNKSVTNGGSSFRMPLHYPRYTKQDYQDMPEWMLDRLLADYGLPAAKHDDLSHKRRFAMGAFLWPSTDHPQSSSPKPSHFQSLVSSLHKKMVWVEESSFA